MSLWKVLYGSFLVIPQGGGFLEPFRPHVMKHLFSGWNGLLTNSPFLILGFVGLILVWKKDRRLCIALAVPVVLHLYINMANINWFSGMSFGARRICASLPLLVFGFAGILDRLRLDKHRRATILLSIAIIFIFLFHILYVIFFRRGTFTYYMVPWQMWIWGNVLKNLVISPAATFADSLPLKYILMGRHIGHVLILGVFLMFSIALPFLITRRLERHTSKPSTIIPIFLVLLIILTAFIYVGNPPYKAGLLTRDGIDAHDRHDVEGSLSILSKAVQEDPGNCLTRFKHMISKLSAGETEASMSQEIEDFITQCGKFAAGALYENKRLTEEQKRLIVTECTDKYHHDEYITGNTVLGLLKYKEYEKAGERLAASYIPTLPWMKLSMRISEEEKDYEAMMQWCRRLIRYQPADTTAYWTIREISRETGGSDADWDMAKINNTLERLLLTRYTIIYHGTQLYGDLSSHWYPSITEATGELTLFLKEEGRDAEARDFEEKTNRLINISKGGFLLP
jgi:hypothetical protein